LIFIVYRTFSAHLLQRSRVPHYYLAFLVALGFWVAVRRHGSKLNDVSSSKNRSNLGAAVAVIARSHFANANQVLH
jgi:hypothetical protein